MRFKYLLDPLFLICVGLYLANRFILKPHLPTVFFRCYLNDVMCIPFWVPIMLYMLRKCRLRKNDARPSAHEIVVPLILWSIIFEIWLPATSLFKGVTTADYLDVFAYTCGATVAAAFWAWYYRNRPIQAKSPRAGTKPDFSVRNR